MSTNYLDELEADPEVQKILSATEWIVGYNFGNRWSPEILKLKTINPDRGDGEDWISFKTTLCVTGDSLIFDGGTYRTHSQFCVFYWPECDMAISFERIRYDQVIKSPKKLIEFQQCIMDNIEKVEATRMSLTLSSSPRRNITFSEIGYAI
jgi:hypothetical protein